MSHALASQRPLGVLESRLHLEAIGLTNHLFDRKSMDALRIHTATVLPEWIDYNDHMSEGYYGVAFGAASDALLEHCGFDATYRAEVGGAFYTVETHVRFLRELDLADPISFETVVLGVDTKRVHLFHRMLHAESGDLAATQETLMLHVHRSTVRVFSMRGALLDRLRSMADKHADLPRPDGVGAAVRAMR